MKTRRLLPIAAPILLGSVALTAWIALPSHEGLGVLDVPELVQRLDDPQRPPVLVDANSADTREKNGVIPGARLLTSYRDYDPERELPADRFTPLVFYCYNAWCTSATEAARKARDAGYHDVSVLPEGLAGWIRAGRTVARLTAGVRS
ncbi:MAG: rhodanese-like domain-containing protein [Myxococcota bacterium]